MIDMFHTRAFYFSVVALVLLSIILTRIPLFNYLGFEFSIVIALAAGYGTGLLTIALWRQQSIQTKNDVWQFIVRVSVAVLVLTLFPFLIATANALLIKNCSFGDGISFYALLVLPTVLFSESLALLISVVIDRWRKTGFSILFLCILVHIPFVVFLYPQNFVYNPIIGFFPGFSYDEIMHFSRSLVMYRIMTLVATLFLFAVSVWIWQTKRIRQNPEHIHHQKVFLELVLMALIVPLLVIMFLFSDRLGFSSSESFIKQKLGGGYRTAHVDIVYPAGSLKPDAAERLGELHEFYYQQLCAQLHVAPSWRLTTFIYESSEQKGKLMGAAQTDITKPWLHQIHINMADVGVGLKHEMTHALAAELNGSLLRVPMNSGLVEGVAVAFGDDLWYGEPLDRAVALIFASGANISPEQLFTNTGFFQSYSGISYAVAGSFCKYLVETYGIEKLKLVYASGNIPAVYRRDVSSLLGDWKQKINRQALTSADSVKARFYFKRSSIFMKDCARVLANQNDETKTFLAQHDFEHALASAEQSLRLHKTPEAISQKVTALFELQKYSEVITFCHEGLSDSAVAPMLLPLHLRLGDAYWALDSLQQAISEYQHLTAIGFGQWSVEGCALRLEALSLDDGRILRALIIISMEDTMRINQLTQLHSPLARYLLAQEYIKKQQYVEAEKLLESFSWNNAPVLEFFRLERLGKSYFMVHEPVKAQVAFVKAKQLAPTESYKIETNEWLERCEFSQR
jgi:tetratricopeptide (TPR) repeat protein